MIRNTLLATSALFVVACMPQEDMAETSMANDDMAPAVMADEADTMMVSYGDILSDDRRSAENRARDQYRHPMETLAFFGLEPGMTVVEVTPGGGWYTEILAPAVGEEGILYAANYPADLSDRAAAGAARFQEKLGSDPAYGNVQISEFAPDRMNVAPAGTADLVLTFRNVHNWYMNDFAEDAFASFYTALKPGGILGVVEHEMPETASDEMQKTSGYMKRSSVVAMAEAAGFELVEASDINANPNDTADYEKGVWTLPPNYAEGDTDRDRYAAIGESNRMTLKFRKPA
ncbi:MAG: methyltransferase [Pacificimonas sp.]